MEYSECERFSDFCVIFAPLVVITVWNLEMVSPSCVTICFYWQILPVTPLQTIIADYRMHKDTGEAMCSVPLFQCGCVVLW